jgi:hypothetical protein
MDRRPRCQRRWWLALALAAALSPVSASAASLSAISIVLAPANTPDFLDNGGAAHSANASAVSVLSSGAAGFSTRYAAVVGADGGNDVTRTLVASFTISFQVNALAGELWDVVLDFGRAGSMGIVSDGTGDATVAMGAMSGTLGGAGALSAGSLGLAAVPNTSNVGNQAQSPNAAFSQSGSATISGVGTGAAQLVSITFTFNATATSNDLPGGGANGDEAALRMGLESGLVNFAADDAPGAGDGVVVIATLVPEPDTALLISLGLGGLALLGRDRRVRQSA